MATICFATGAIVGWPFALALAIPFVFEELFVFGTDRVPADMYQSWLFKRWKRLFEAGIATSLIFVIRPFILEILIPNLFLDPGHWYRQPRIWKTDCGTVEYYSV